MSMRLLILFLAISSLSFSINYLSNCTEISKHGDYVLTKDLHFAKTPETYQNPGDVCLRITSSNVNLDCNGHSITGSNENNTYGVYTYDIQNFSMKNCNVSSFGICVYLRDSYYDSIDHNSVSCAVYLGDFPVNSSSEVSITNNLFLNSSLIDAMPANLTIINNTFLGRGGISVGLDSNSVVSGNNINHNGSYCAYLSSSGFGVVISNNSFSFNCPVYLHGEGLIFANNSLSSSFSDNGLDISRLKNSQLINNTICSSGLNRSTSYNNEYFDIYNAGIATNITYINNTCDTSNPKHICTKSCKGSDVLSKSNCPFSFILIGFVFLAFLRGKTQ
jgi:hypothetical protein